MENLSDFLRQMQEKRRAAGDAGRDVGVNGDSPFDGNGGGQPPDEPDCPICGGRLWLAFDVPVGHPDFGRVEPCGCRADVELNERATRLRRYSNLGPLSKMTFGTLDPQGRAHDAESGRLFGIAYEAALEYAERPVGWLTLTGPNGSGKTHLAAAIANHRIELGSPVFFVHVPDLLDDLRSTYSPTSEISYSDLFEQVNDAPLLILDGLGVQSPTPWAQEKLQQIFNHRANAESPTVITTAFDPNEIDPYISSRLTNPKLGRALEVRSRSQEPARRLGGVRGETIDRMTFESFDTRGNNATAQERASLDGAFGLARAYAENPEGWLTMFGDTGVGKTHLAAAISVERRQRGDQVSFVFVPELMDHLRTTFQPDSGAGFDRTFDQIKNAPLLVLDDLGGEHRSDWAYEKLYQIIVHRHNMRMPTVITSPNDLSESRGPISSRIQDPSTGWLIRMEAPDYRVKRRDGNRHGMPERERGRRRRGR